MEPHRFLCPDISVSVRFPYYWFKPPRIWK